MSIPSATVLTSPPAEASAASKRSPAGRSGDAPPRADEQQNAKDLPKPENTHATENQTPLKAKEQIPPVATHGKPENKSNGHDILSEREKPNSPRSKDVGPQEPQESKLCHLLKPSNELKEPPDNKPDLKSKEVSPEKDNHHIPGERGSNPVLLASSQPVAA